MLLGEPPGTPGLCPARVSSAGAVSWAPFSGQWGPGACVTQETRALVPTGQGHQFLYQTVEKVSAGQAPSVAISAP